MSDDSSSTEPVTTRQLVVAAVALAVVGVVLVGTSLMGDDDATASQAGAEAATSPSHDRPAEPPAEPDQSYEQQPTPTPTVSSGVDGSGPSPVPLPGEVNNQPSDIALAAVGAVYTMDTATDDGPRAALSRAEPWLADSNEADAYDLGALADSVDEQWSLWVEHAAYMSIDMIADVVANDSDTPEERGDTSTAAVRRIDVTYTPVGRDGWSGEPVDDTWYVSLSRASTGKPWRITELRRPVVVPPPMPSPTSGDPTATPGVDDPGEVDVEPQDGGWVVPLDGDYVMTAGFRVAGESGETSHAGVDLVVRGRTPVVAAAAGTIAIKENLGDQGYGRYIVVTHADGVSTWYCDLSELTDVRVGETVEAGQALGYVGVTGGGTGDESGSSLHFEVRTGSEGSRARAVDGVPIDPEPWMTSQGAEL